MAKFCIWCGAQAEDDAVFCPNCGKRVDGADAMQQPPQQQQRRRATVRRGARAVTGL